MFPVAIACGSRYHSLTSQVDLINTEKIGKVEFYASFANCIAIIDRYIKTHDSESRGQEEPATTE